jgi:MFS family permease
MPGRIGLLREKNTNKIMNKLWLAIFWVSFPFGIVSFLLPIYGKELGASAVEIGGFFSAFSLVPALIRPFLGQALDRYGRRPFLIAGLAGYVFSTLMFSVADTILLLTIARFLQGIGSSFLWISAFTIVADLAKVQGRGHDFGSIDEASYRGALLGTIFGFSAILTFEAAFGIDLKTIWFWIFIIFLGPVLIGFWNGWIGAEETVPEDVKSNRDRKPISRQLVALMGIVMVTGASQAMVWPLLMIFLQDKLGAGVISLAVAYLPAALISSFLPSRMGIVTDRLGRKGPMIAGLLVGSAASLLIPGLRSLTALTILWSVETIGYTISLPAERAFVADIAGRDIRGKSYGLYTFSFFLGGALGPLVGGWLYDNAGHAMPFYLNSVVLILGAALVLFVLHEPANTDENISGNAKGKTNL